MQMKCLTKLEKGKKSFSAPIDNHSGLTEDTEIGINGNDKTNAKVHVVICYNMFNELV